MFKVIMSKRISFLIFFVFCSCWAFSQSGKQGETISNFSFALVDEQGQETFVKGTQAEFLQPGLMRMVQVTASLYQNDALALEIYSPVALAGTKTGIIESQSYVSFTGQDSFFVEGTGMFWDTNKKKLSVLKNVSSIFNTAKQMDNYE